MDKTCHTCQYLRGDEDHTSNFCVRYPPTLLNHVGTAMFPSVIPERHWCGEYTEVEETYTLTPEQEKQIMDVVPPPIKDTPFMDKITKKSRKK